MGTVTAFVGLDYHDEAVQVCVLDGQGQQLANRSCVNDAAGIVAFVQRHGQRVQAAVESCAGAANLADELVNRFGWSVDLAHPGFVARMKQNPDKTDFQDAHVLADLERVGYLPRVWLAPEPVRELRQLVRYRQQLIERRRATKLRIRAVLREQRCRAAAGINAWTQAWYRWLTRTASLSAQARWVVERHVRDLTRLAEDIHEVEERLQQVTADDAEVKRLLAQRGIGPVTAWTLRAEIGRFDRFRSGKQLARLCGLSPKNASSGQRQSDAGLIRAANPQLRSVLIEAAHRLIRLEPRWRILAQRLRAGGKPGSLVAAAVANRWVRWLFHQLQAA